MSLSSLLCIARDDNVEVYGNPVFPETNESWEISLYFCVQSKG